MKKILYLLIISNIFSAFSQKKYKKEFSFYNDNDLYTSTHKDRYYTSGLFLNYSYLSSKKTTKNFKKIYHLQVAQLMYTPFNATVDLKGLHDRPFAAYSYFSFGQHYFTPKKAYTINVQLGILGPSALGWETQDFIHGIYGFKKAIGWKYQIKNALGLNLNTSYTQNIFKSNYLETSWINTASLGTVFTNIASGFNFRIGIISLQKTNNSIAYKSNFNNSNTLQSNNKELFFFIKPMLHYVLYDATIQGSFLNTSSPITFDIVPIKLTTHIGIQASFNRFNFGYFINYHSKKLKSNNVPNWNKYGTILLNYQFN